LHLGFQSGAKGVEEVTTRSDSLVLGEETDPSQAGKDSLFLRLRRERSLALDRGDEVGFLRGRGRESLGGDFSPGESLRVFREVIDG